MNVRIKNKNASICKDLDVNLYNLGMIHPPNYIYSYEKIRLSKTVIHERATYDQ